MKIAVVFDSAGTLLRMHRVAKNIKTGEFLMKWSLPSLWGENHIAPSWWCRWTRPNWQDAHLRCWSPIFSKEQYRYWSGMFKKQDRKDRCFEGVNNDTQARMKDLQDVMAAVKKKCKNIFYLELGLLLTWILTASRMWYARAVRCFLIHSGDKDA